MEYATDAANCLENVDKKTDDSASKMKKSAEKTSKALGEIENSAKEADKAVETLKPDGLDSVSKAAEETKKALDEVDRSAKKAGNSIKIIRGEGHTGTWGDGERTVDIKPGEYQKIDQGTVQEYLNGSIEESVRQTETLAKKIGDAKAKLKELESQGLNIDDEPYKEAFLNLQNLLAEENRQKEAIKQQSIQMNNFASEVEIAKAKLKELESQGLSIDDESYREAYSALQDLLVEEQRQKDIIKQQSIQMYAFSSEIDVAKAKLKELSLTGYGPGDEEYEKASIALQELIDKEKQYKAEIAKQTESGRAKEAEKERIAAELKEKAEQRMFAQIEKNVQKEADRAQKLAEQEAKIAKQKAEEEELVRIKENATIADRKLVELLERQKTLQEYINKLKQAGVGEGYKEYDKAISDLAKVNVQINQQRSYVNPLIAALNGLKSALSGIGSISKKAFSGMISLPRKAASGVLSLGKAAVKGISSFARLQKSGINALRNIRSHSKTASGAMGKFGNRILSLAKTVFVFNLLRKGFQAMLSGMKEGFQNYLAYDANLKNSVEGLKASLNTVKANLGSAFAPIVQTVLPYLQMLVEWINTAVNAVNQFISSILGRTTYKRAASGVGNVSNGVGEMADNMGEAAQQAKKLEKALAHYDELNVIQKNDDSGTSGSGSKTPTSAGTEGLGLGYEDVAIDSKIKAMADKIKKYLSDIFKPMKASWDKYGQSVIGSWKKALTNIMELLKVVANTFRDVWTNGTGEEVCGNILLILKMIGDMLASIAKAFVNAWNDNNRGYNYIQSVFNRFNSILSLIRIMGQSLLTVWNSGSGEQIIGHLLEIFTNINNAIANIRNNFAKAWKLDDTGTKIIQDMADLFNILLGHVNNVTKGMEKWTKELDFSPLLKALNNITTALKPLGDKVGAGLEWLFINILQPLAKWALESFIPKALDAIAVALDALDALLEVVKPIFSWLLDNFLNPLSEWTGGLIMDILNGIMTAFEGLHDTFQMIAEGKDWKEIGKFIWQGIINGITNFLNWAWTKLKEAFWGIVDFVKKLFGIHSPSTVFEELGGYMIDGLLGGIIAGLKNIGAWIKKHILDPILGGITGAASFFKEAGEKLWGGIKNAYDGAKKKITATITAVKEKAFDTAKKAWDSVKTKITTLTTKVKEAASGSLEKIKSGWDGIKNKSVSVAVGVKEAAKGIWSKVTGFFSGKKSEAEVDETINVGTKLVKSGWDSLEKFIGNKVDVKISLKKGFDSLTKFIGEKVTVKVSLGKSGWSSISKFIGTLTNVNISLKKKGWTNITKFVGSSVDVKINLKKSGWKDIKSFVGSAVSVDISLRKSGWNTISKFVGTSVNVNVNLKIVKKLNSLVPSSISVGVNFNAKRSVQSLVPNWVEVAVYFYAARSVQSLVPNWVEVPTYFTRRADGGVYKNGQWSEIPQFAFGGIIDTLRGSITRFASGGSARGTLFYAGEAGPEIVGNAGGGQSEVLNKSQIASAIYSAVVAGIRVTLGSFASVIANMVEKGTTDMTESLNDILEQLQNIQSTSYSGIAIPKAMPYNLPDTNRINSYKEAEIQRNIVSADNFRLISDLANKPNGPRIIENIMYLDGKVVYKDMVEIDKTTVKQTGKSGFAY
mgnify:CR=1 FL=1